MTELVQVCRRLWTEEEVTFTGRYFRLEKNIMDPKPIQPGGIPMLLACHYSMDSEAQYRRAGCNIDGVIGISDTPDQYSETLQRVRSYVVGAGRNANIL